MFKKAKRSRVCQTKYEFLAQLERSLRRLDPSEKADTLAFYDEMISDKIEAGMSEQQAVYSLGDIADIKTQAAADSAEKSLAEARPKRPLRTFFVVLAACTSPVLVTVGIVLAVLMLVLVASFAATGVGLAAGAAYSLVLSVTNTYFVAAGGKAAGAAMSFFACIFTAALLAILSAFFIKISKLMVKVVARFFVKIVKKDSKKRAEKVAA